MSDDLDSILFRRLRYMLSPQLDLYRSIGQEYLGDVLEVGFGTGFGTLQLAHNANKVLAIEIDQAAVEFAKAAAIRPQIVGAALQKIARDKEVFEALFAVLETQRLIEGEAHITLLPPGGAGLAELLASRARSDGAGGRVASPA